MKTSSPQPLLPLLHPSTGLASTVLTLSAVKALLNGFNTSQPQRGGYATDITSSSLLAYPRYISGNYGRGNPIKYEN
jgi:hypothetical protein